ncbi:MAG: hypothetical protein HN413_00430 [Chloroflexi bacterium]|jgi:hypothetical protein|nr:hypothetical protein [Chloroflexota bacterium]
MNKMIRILTLPGIVLVLSLLSTKTVAAQGETIPNPPMGLYNYDSAFVPLAGGTTTEVCFTLPDYANRENNIYIRYWAVDSEKWVELKTTFNQGVACATATTPGIFALQGPQWLRTNPPPPPPTPSPPPDINNEGATINLFLDGSILLAGGPGILISPIPIT